MGKDSYVALNFLLAMLAIFTSSKSFAHPVSYKDATSAMTWNQSFLTDIWTTYSWRDDAAIAARYMRMTMKDHQQFQLYTPQLDLLLHRWNEKSYQANIYAYGGFG